MANEAAKTQTINIVPVQGIFQPEPTFDLITLIGPAGTPFYAKIDPNQSGLNITNSTINSTTIGAITPSTGVFTDIATTTGTISSVPSGPTSIVNQAYVDAIAQGLAFKAPANFTTTGNITLSGLAVQAGGDWNVTLTAGNRILVKDQTAGADNGIYLAAAGAWTRSLDANTYDELLSAYLFVLDGVTLAGSAWVDTNLPGGTLGVTAITFVRFANTAIYSAGTGLTLTNYVFSITPVGTAGTYGSASAVPVFVTNASGQVSSVTNTPIAIANTQVSGLGTMSTQNANAVAITGGTIDGTTIGGSTAAAVTGAVVTANTYFSGAGTNLTGTASGLSIGGNAATATTATSATTATNLAGGASGSLPYQTAPSTTTFLAAGSNGQVLTLASGVPSWATPTTGTVTSVGTAGTVNGLTLTGGPITSSGTITLGGTLDLSSPPTIGNTTPNTGRFTTLTVDDNSTFGTSNTDTINFVGRINSDFDPATDNTYDLGRVGHEWRNLYIDGTANIDSLIADTADINAGTIDNTSIGVTTAAAGYFTTLSLTSTLAVNGSTGTNGQVLQSNGSSAPTWVTPSSYATVTDDTTTNATRYPLYADQTTGNLTTEFVSSTKLQFNPSTGVFTSTSFSGAGTGLTGTATSLSIGGNAATATSATTATNIAGGTANQIPFQTGAGATSFIVAPTVSNTALTWDGSAFAWVAGSGGLTIVDDTTTNATRYLTFTSATTGTITSENVSSTKLTFNPSTGILAATGFSGAFNGTIGATTANTGAFTTLSATGVTTVQAGTVSLPAITTSGDTNTGIFFPAADTIAFSEGGVESMRLDSIGNAIFKNAFSKVFSISASVAANALTISASPLSLDFRSVTLGSGTVTTVSGTPANLVISSGSTLGTVNNVASRIVVIALNNAGTIELAAVNISGGTQLDETNLISTTAEGGSGGADSATVVYSTTARTSLAYRVIGFIQSTQATAGTWVTAPSTIQGVGGQAMTAMSSLGYGQTWQNVASSRAVGTTYTNTTGKPIQVQVTSNSGVGNNVARLTIDGIIVSAFKDNDYYTASLVTPHNVTNMGIVPPSSTYSITNSNSGTTIQYWAELR